MLKDKSFQIGYLICQVLSIIMMAVVAIPFVMDMFKWEELPQFPIWVIQIFFLILTIIFIVVTFKLFQLRDNKLKIINLLLTFGIVATFLFELSYCFMRMGA